MKKGNCRFVKCVFAVAASLSLCSCNLCEDVVSDFIWGFAKLTIVPTNDPPYHSYPIIDNGSSKDVTFVMVESDRAKSNINDPESEFVNIQIVSSISVLEPQQNDVLALRTAFKTQETVAIEQFVSTDRAENIRFVAIEGDVANEMLEAAWWERFKHSLEN